MREPVYVIGAGRTDFKRNLAKEGKALRDVVVEAGRAAIAEAKIEPRDVKSGVVGNFAAGRFTKQLHLGSYLTYIDESLRGLPTFHAEAACASGSVAVIAGIHQVVGGLYDCVIVVGAEQQKTMSPADVGDVLASAGDYGHERPMYGTYTFPSIFGKLAQIYNEKHGLGDKTLPSIAYKNRAHARLNPMAQMRDVELTQETACTASQANPDIAPPLKLSDCSQITDGAAAIVLCSEKFLMNLPNASQRKAMRLLGWGHTTDHLPLDEKDAPTFSVARQSAKRAFDMANVTPRDLQGADIHDCFSISEVVAYEILGMAEPGQGKTLAESGATRLPQIGGPKGRVPVNPGGGLIGDGHPVGATGVRQVVEAYQQLTGQADKRQIENARRYLTFNMGGSMTTNCTMIWGAL
jgi:acetyl-CoA C-acetyltransferase